jgi:hypothetical protein
LSVKIVKIDFVLDVFLSLLCGGKIGSFGFACVSACAVGAKPNVPMFGWQNFKIFCAVEKNKTRSVGLSCRKKVRCKFICRPVVSILSVSLMVVVSVFTLAYNVSQLYAGRDFHH